MPSRRSAYPAVGREPRADQLLQHHGVSAGHALRQNFQQPMHCTEQHSNALSGNSAQHQPADQLHSVGKPVEVGSKLCTLCCERIQVVAFARCNHKDICADCMLRMVMLYKKLQCPLCNGDLDQIIVTPWVEPEPPDWSHWANIFHQLWHKPEWCAHIYISPDQHPSRDRQLHDHFQRLTARACSICDPEADHPLPSDGGLLTHVAVCHQRHLCLVCLQSGRCSFPLKSPMYTKPALESHLINHPSCRFCDLPFYDEEELEEHLVDEHDYCSICDEDVIDTDALAEHLRNTHWVCTEPACQHNMVAFAEVKQLVQHYHDEHDCTVRGARRRIGQELKLFAEMPGYSRSQKNGARQASSDEAHGAGISHALPAIAAPGSTPAVCAAPDNEAAAESDPLAQIQMQTHQAGVSRPEIQHAEAHAVTKPDCASTFLAFLDDLAISARVQGSSIRQSSPDGASAQSIMRAGPLDFLSAAPVGDKAAAVTRGTYAHISQQHGWPSPWNASDTWASAESAVWPAVQASTASSVPALVPRQGPAIGCTTATADGAFWAITQPNRHVSAVASQPANLPGFNQITHVQHSLYSRSGTEPGEAAGKQLQLPPACGRGTATYAPDKASSHTAPGLLSTNATYFLPAGHLLQSDYQHGWKVDAEPYNVGTITPQQNSLCSNPWWPNHTLDIDPGQSTTVEAPAHPDCDPSDLTLADLSLEADQLELSPHNGRDSLEMFRDHGHQAMWTQTTAPQPEENPWVAVKAQTRDINQLHAILPQDTSAAGSIMLQATNGVESNSADSVSLVQHPSEPQSQPCSDSSELVLPPKPQPSKRNRSRSISLSK